MSPAMRHGQRIWPAWRRRPTGAGTSRLDADVRASQARRRLVAAALATGAVTAWDHASPDDGARRYIGTGCDFWSTLEARAGCDAGRRLERHW